MLLAGGLPLTVSSDFMALYKCCYYYYYYYKGNLVCYKNGHIIIIITKIKNFTYHRQG